MKILLFALLITFSSLHANDTIKLMTEIFPPFQYKLDLITSGADEKNIKKLVKGRIDLWPTLLRKNNSKI